MQDRQEVPTANFVVQYKRSETGVKGLHGLVASDLSVCEESVRHLLAKSPGITEFIMHRMLRT